MTETQQSDTDALIQRLRVSEELYARAFMSNPVAMSLTDVATHRFTHINSAFAELVGYTRSDILGRTSEDLRFWPEREAREEIGRRIAERDDFPLIRSSIRNRDGELVPVLVSYRLLSLPPQPAVLSVLVPLEQ